MKLIYRVDIFRKAEQQIDYLEENFIRPLKDFEAKTGKVIMANKSRKTLQQIQGIIETNALYLTENNQVCGKSKSFEVCACSEIVSHCLYLSMMRCRMLST